MSAHRVFFQSDETEKQMEIAGWRYTETINLFLSMSKDYEGAGSLIPFFSDRGQIARR